MVKNIKAKTVEVAARIFLAETRAVGRTSLGDFTRPISIALSAHSSFWRTGGIARIVVAWDFALDIPDKAENAYLGQGAPRMGFLSTCHRWHLFAAHVCRRAARLCPATNRGAESSRR